MAGLCNSEDASPPDVEALPRMAIELAEIAASAIGSFVVPLLVKGSETISADLGKTLGESAAGGVTNIAQRVWERIKVTFGSPREQAAVERFEEDPELYAQPVQTLLEERLREDPALVADLVALLRQPVADGHDQAWQVMGNYVGLVNVHQSTFAGGRQTISGVTVGGEERTAPRADIPPPTSDER